MAGYGCRMLSCTLVNIGSGNRVLDVQAIAWTNAALFHPSIHIQFYVKGDVCIHCARLEAPGYGEHWLSIYICLVGQREPGHNNWHQSSAFRPRLSRLSLLSGVRNRKVLIDLIQDVACCTWLYNLSFRLWRTAVIPAMPSFCSSEAKGVSSWPLVPQVQWIMGWSLRWSRCVQGYLVLTFRYRGTYLSKRKPVYLVMYFRWKVSGG